MAPLKQFKRGSRLVHGRRRARQLRIKRARRAEKA